ncbi:DUF924 family protein [Duganella vulcania]|uniref:DUF924 family protein n=1 Tax=Duganella vulcania TaxID=2692166 RepID=UPI0035A3CA18
MRSPSPAGQGHWDTIRRFARFPHRNALLWRRVTTRQVQHSWTNLISIASLSKSRKWEASSKPPTRWRFRERRSQPLFSNWNRAWELACYTARRGKCA